MPERDRGFFARLNAQLRHLMLACAVIAAMGLAAWLFVLSQIHDEIRCEVERRFLEQYTGVEVSVRDAKLIEGQGIEVHGLTISRSSDGQPLVYVDEIYTACPIDAQCLLSGEHPQAQHVQIRGLKIWAERQQDGSWDVERLWPMPSFGPLPPPLTITDAVIEISDPSSECQRKINLRNVNLQIEPDWESADESRGGLYADQPPRRLSGSLGGDHVERIDFTAWIDPVTGAYHGQGNVHDLQLSPQLHTALPCPLQEQLAAVASVAGRVDLAFEVAGNTNREGLPQFSVTGDLAEGQIIDARLPYRLYDLQAHIRASDQELHITDVFARNGAAKVILNLSRLGWQKDSPMKIDAQARELELDRRFVEVLPDEFQAVWRKYFPAGVIDAEIHLDFDGQRWTPELDVDCRDVSFAYYKFPYRLERSQGNIRLKNDHLSVHLVAEAAGQPVNLDSEIQSPGGDGSGWFTVSCKSPIPLDEKLISAIVDPKAQAVLRSLNPGGMFICTGRFDRLAPGAAVTREVRIELVNCSMRYDKFPYPFGMIRGTIVWNDEGWLFRDLSGRNDSGYVECKGSWTPAEDGGSLLSLDFIGTDVPLQNDLRNAITPEAQRLWDQLRPRGTIDDLRVGMRYASASRKFSLGLRAENRKRRSNDRGRSITVFPVWFPYRMDDVAGVFTYQDGEVRMENVSAGHSDTEIRLTGTCNFDRTGAWRVHLANLEADRVEADRELLAALPKRLGRAVGKLNIAGDLGLNGSLAFSGNTHRPKETAAVWDMTVDVENADLQCGLQLDHIHGDVRLVGSMVGTTYASRGELNIDSMFCKGLQLTRVQGPLLIGPEHIIFGLAAERDITDRPPRSVTATMIDGRLTLDSTIWLNEDTSFRLRSKIEGGELDILARELAINDARIQGKINGVVELVGNRHGWPSWQGKGDVRLYEADIYEIPQMLALLKVLRIRPPDTTGFTSSDIDFRLRGDRVYFDRIHFNGDAISLKGKGELDIDRHLDLEFYALVGRELNVPIVQTILRQASRQLLRIYVKGTLDRPDMTREALPLLKETLQQLFPEATNRTQLTGPPALPGYQAMQDHIGGWRR